MSWRHEYVYNVINKILSVCSNQIVYEVMWLNFNNSSIYFYERRNLKFNDVRIWPAAQIFLRACSII